MKTKLTFSFIWMVALVLCFGQIVYAAGHTQLIVGPENPTNGFPQFVSDSNRLSVELCLDSDPPGSGLPPNCFFDAPDPANLFSAQIGFGAEASPAVDPIRHQ